MSSALLQEPVLKLLKFAAALLLALLSCLSLPALAQSAQPVPALTERMMDSTNTLKASDKQALEQQLKALEDSTGAQVAVLMVNTTAPEDIAAYANRIAQNWKIGRKDIGDGVLIVVAKNDRRMRIEVARRLEGAIPDLMAARVIDEAMKPRFRADDYAGGLRDAIDRLGMLIRGEKLPPPPAVNSGASQQVSSVSAPDALIPFLFFGFAVAMPLMRMIFGKGASALIMGGVASAITILLTGSLFLAIVAGIIGLFFTLAAGSVRGGGGGGSGGPYISGGGGSWGSSSSSSSSSGGGFSSGGGGSFGGGGASGGW